MPAGSRKTTVADSVARQAGRRVAVVRRGAFASKGLPPQFCEGHIRDGLLGRQTCRLYARPHPCLKHFTSSSSFVDVQPSPAHPLHPGACILNGFASE
mmetsp:Transcript_3912/g.10846  ORF Transcript_3912/g.10846 Transcript_3912/m.10846 type:complete len:98 (+) Transcript_3912:1250-1543(+)